MLRVFRDASVQTEPVKPQETNATPPDHKPEEVTIHYLSYFKVADADKPALEALEKQFAVIIEVIKTGEMQLIATRNALENPSDPVNVSEDSRLTALGRLSEINRGLSRDMAKRDAIFKEATKLRIREERNALRS